MRKTVEILDFITVISNMNIEKWLNEFKTNWINKNVLRITELFSDDIEYWENPYKKLASLEEIKSEWLGINNQDDIKVKTTVFLESEKRDCFTVLWELSYILNGGKNSWAGVYLIKLNLQGQYYYFYQTGERL